MITSYTIKLFYIAILYSQILQLTHIAGEGGQEG